MDFVHDCIQLAQPAWDRLTHHPWVEALFAGTLGEERFEYWLAQDLPYLSERITAMTLGKAPPHNPWGRLEAEYISRARTSRVELYLLDRYGEHAATRWAARPQREAFNNFFVRTVFEGNFGEICAAFYPCYAFPETFGHRYLAERPTNLPARQQEWVEQWIEPFYVSLWHVTADGLNEYGACATPYEQEKLRWILLRSTQHQIGTFDAAWNLSDPWPGEGREVGVMAGRPAQPGLSQEPKSRADCPKTGKGSHEARAFPYFWFVIQHH